MGITLSITMHFSHLLALLPLLLTQAHGLDRCPDGWIEAHGGIGMGCLFFCHPEDQQMSHEEATLYCMAKHEEAYLVEVRTSVQQSFLNMAMRMIMEGAGVQESTWWNGATNGGEDGGVWFWEGTGEPIMVDTWQPGEPQLGEGNCAVMESESGFTWKATPCDMSASVVCQIDAPTTHARH